MWIQGIIQNDREYINFSCIHGMKISYFRGETKLRISPRRYQHFENLRTKSFDFNRLKGLFAVEILKSCDSYSQSEGLKWLFEIHIRGGV